MVSSTWNGAADIHIQGAAVEVVDNFCYLDSYILLLLLLLSLLLLLLNKRMIIVT